MIGAMPTNNAPHLVHPGDKFGSLTVLSFSHKDKRWRRHYMCRCACGAEKSIQGTLLRSVNTKSCGCLVSESARKRAIGHGVAAMNQVMAGYRHKAKKSGRSFSLTSPQFRAITQGPCFYCGSERTNTKRSPHGTGDFTYNGLDRIDASRGYTVNNTVSCCRACNFAKSNLGQGEFIEWIRRAYMHLSRTAMAAQWGSL